MKSKKFSLLALSLVGLLGLVACDDSQTSASSSVSSVSSSFSTGTVSESVSESVSSSDSTSVSSSESSSSSSSSSSSIVETTYTVALPTGDDFLASFVGGINTYKAGETVQITITLLDENMELDASCVTSTAAITPEVTLNDNGTYTISFTMPASDVSLTVTPKQSKAVITSITVVNSGYSSYSIMLKDAEGNTIGVNQELPAGTTLYFTLGGVYGSSKNETMGVYVNGVKYKGAMSSETYNFEGSLVLPKGEVSIVVFDDQSTVSETGYQLTYAEQEGLALYGYDATAKYTSFKGALVRQPGYILKSVSTKVGDVTTPIENVEFTDNAYVFDIELTADTELLVEVEYTEPVTIKYENTEHLNSTSLGELVHTATVGDEISFMYSLEANYYVTGPVTYTGLSEEDFTTNTTNRVVFTIPEDVTEITITFHVAENIALSYTANENIETVLISSTAYPYSSQSITSIAGNTTVYAFVQPKAGFILSGAKVNGTAVDSSSIESNINNSFITEGYRITVEVGTADINLEFEVIKGVAITAEAITYGGETIGELTLSKKTVVAGDEVTVTMNAPLYKLTNLVDLNGQALTDLTIDESGSSATFKAPAKDVKLQATVEKKQTQAVDVEIGEGLDFISIVGEQSGTEVYATTTGAEFLPGERIAVNYYSQSYNVKVYVDLLDGTSEEVEEMYSGSCMITLTENITAIRVETVPFTTYTINFTLDTEAGVPSELEYELMTDSYEYLTVEDGQIQLTEGTRFYIRIFSDAPEGKEYVATAQDAEGNTESVPVATGFSYVYYTVTEPVTITISLATSCTATINNLPGARCSLLTPDKSADTEFDVTWEESIKITSDTYQYVRIAPTQYIGDVNYTITVGENTFTGTVKGGETTDVDVGLITGDISIEITNAI